MRSKFWRWRSRCNCWWCSSPLRWWEILRVLCVVVLVLLYCAGRCGEAMVPQCGVVVVAKGCFLLWWCFVWFEETAVFFVGERAGMELWRRILEVYIFQSEWTRGAERWGDERDQSNTNVGHDEKERCLSSLLCICGTITDFIDSAQGNGYNCLCYRCERDLRYGPKWVQKFLFFFAAPQCLSCYSFHRQDWSHTCSTWENEEVNTSYSVNMVGDGGVEGMGELQTVVAVVMMKPSGGGWHELSGPPSSCISRGLQ